MQNQIESIQNAMNGCYARAKQLGAISISCRIGIFLIGIFATLYEITPMWLPIFIFFSSILVETLSISAAAVNSKASELKKAVEIFVGLGIPPQRTAISDISASIWCLFAPKVPELIKHGNQFACSEPQGPRKLVENTIESAWWSRHQARFCVIYLILLMAILLIIPFMAVLSISFNIGSPFLLDGQKTSEIGIMTMLLVFNLSLVKSAIDFCDFSSGTLKVISNGAGLLLRDDINGEDARLLYEEYYQIRTVAPPIPTWVWRSLRDKLNRTWIESRPF